MGGGRRVALLASLGALACGGADGEGVVASTPTSTPTSTVPTVPVAPAVPSTPGGAPAGPVTVALVVESLVADIPTEELRAAVISTLLDRRGWTRAGFAFTFDDPSAPFLLVLAEGEEVDRRCAPYDTAGRYSCQLGPTVALNADRWRTATPEWTGDLATYRQMLVNHEVGHLLGQHHPAQQCPAAGEPAPVMAQQSTELDGCLPNPWPLEWEVACAARHDEPLAPGYEPDVQATCDEDG